SNSAGSGSTDRDGAVGGAVDGGDAGDWSGPGQGDGGHTPGPSFDGGTDPGGFDLDTLTIVYDGPEAIELIVGEPIEPITFRATVDDRPISVGWSVDRGELATIDDRGLLTPTGALG